MKIRVSSRARARIRRLDEWWRTSRDAADLFRQELAEAFHRIAIGPRLQPPYAQLDGRAVWRILMSKTEPHVYYTVDDARGEIIVETVWGARRGRGPKL